MTVLKKKKLPASGSVNRAVISGKLIRVFSFIYSSPIPEHNSCFKEINKKKLSLFARSKVAIKLINVKFV